METLAESVPFWTIEYCFTLYIYAKLTLGAHP